MIEKIDKSLFKDDAKSWVVEGYVIGRGTTAAII